jgi:hypothetical protein
MILLVDGSVVQGRDIVLMIWVGSALQGRDSSGNGPNFGSPTLHSRVMWSPLWKHWVLKAPLGFHHGNHHTALCFQFSMFPFAFMNMC